MSSYGAREGIAMAGRKRKNADYTSLSDRQRRIYECLRNTTNMRGYPPSIREICQATGLASTSTANYHLRKLEEMGFIQRVPGMPRAIQVIDVDKVPEPTPPPAPEVPASAPVIEITSSAIDDEETAVVPLLGRIAAGTPILAEENVEDVMSLPRTIVGYGSLFMLNVVGDSMINASICDGDWVIVRSQQSAENGDIVAALLDDEATVKTFKRNRAGVWLLPHNPAYDPIPADDARIMGKVVAVIRKV